VFFLLKINYLQKTRVNDKQHPKAQKNAINYSHFNFNNTPAEITKTEAD
jgi:hypothetical protein